ncbi:MAG: transposase [Cupriavidus sp.]|nr:transposase [Cupriavidus sp.]
MSKQDTDAAKQSDYAGEFICYVPKPALWLGNIVTDIPPVVQPVGRAICRHPVELLYYWARFGFPRYAVEDFDDRITWSFSNDRQEAAALGFKWLENNCALEQIPVNQDGEVVYGYVARGVKDETDIETILYDSDLWSAAGADMNEAATREIMTRVRMEIFQIYSLRGGPFFMLDFSKPADVARYLAEWVAEILASVPTATSFFESLARDVDTAR